MENINYNNQTNFTRWLQVLDERFWCPDKRELIILFWFSSAGKTEYAYFVARANWKRWNKVLYLSLELPEYDMKLRICRKKAWVSKYEFQKKEYTPLQKQIMEESRKELWNNKNVSIKWIEDKSLWSVMQTLRAAYDLWYRMFIIDNLDKITPDGNDDENKRYQKITTSLQDFKNSCEANIILIHHAKKPDGKWVAYKRAWGAWIRGNQKIIDNSTQVFEIYRDLDPDTVNEVEKARVEIIQNKDTFEWANGFESIYFYKADYYDKEGYREAKFGI